MLERLFGEKPRYYAEKLPDGTVRTTEEIRGRRFLRKPYAEEKVKDFPDVWEAIKHHETVESRSFKRGFALLSGSVAGIPLNADFFFNHPIDSRTAISAIVAAGAGVVSLWSGYKELKSHEVNKGLVDYLSQHIILAPTPKEPLV